MASHDRLFDVVDLLGHWSVDIVRKRREIRTTITDVISAALQARMPLARSKWIFGHMPRTMRAAHGVGFIHPAFTGKFRVVANLASDILAQARRCPMVNHQISHLTKGTCHE